MGLKIRIQIYLLLNLEYNSSTEVAAELQFADDTL
jgi:hypothetical protein